MLRYVALHSRAPTLLLTCAIVFVAIGASAHKTVLLLVGAGEVVGWIVLVWALPQLGLRGTSQEHTISFSEEGVTAANAGGSQRFPWSHWRRWQRNGDLYLLRGAGSIYTFVPGRAFATPAAESEFQALLGRHLGDHRSPGRVLPGAVGEDESG